MYINTPMSATIFKFPEIKQQKTIRLPLYSEEEMAAVIICMNLIGETSEKCTYADLNTLDPFLVISNLNFSLNSNIFSEEFKYIIKNILDNVEEVEEDK